QGRHVRRSGDRKPADLCLGSWSRLQGHATGAFNCAQGGKGQLQVRISDHGGHPEPCLHHEHEKPGGVREGRVTMFISKKHINRRALLRGAGVALGLPLLDAMIPAATSWAKTAAVPPPRFFAGFVPHGAAPGYWIPEKPGALS